MLYAWAKVGQPVACVKPFPKAELERGAGFVPREREVYQIAKVAPGISTTGKPGVGVGLAEDPTWPECGWCITHFQPVYPQQMEEWRRLAAGGGDGVRGRRAREDA